MISNKEPLLTLFQELIDVVKEKKTQKPITVSQVPVAQYYDTSWFAHEWKSIFLKTPIVIGMSCMVSEVGDHFTHDLMDIPLLIVRGKDQKLRCFLNVCRHRGVRLSNNQIVNNTKTFSCQYHHWTYDLEGRLIFVPSEEGFPGLDKSCHTLKEIPLAEKHGLIWVLPFGDEMPDMNDFLGNIAVDLEEFGFSDSVFYKQNTHHNKANWKFHIEAFEDTYHVTRLHNKTVGSFFADNMAVQVREKDHIRSIVARKNIMNVLDSPSHDWDLRNDASYSHFIWPNTVLIIHPDYLSQCTFYPKSVDETIIVHNCAIHTPITSEKAAAHFEKSFNLIDKGVFANEDFYVSSQAQIGVHSGANEYFTLGGYEAGIRQFHDILYEKTGPYRKLN